MRYIDLGKVKTRRVVPRPRRRWLQFLVVGAVCGAVSVFFLRHTLSLSNLLHPISAFSRILHPKEVQSTDGRTNILLLAVDRRETVDPDCGGGGGSLLTDTIILASLDLSSPELGGAATLISIPRDLWVETGYFSGKINSAYAAGEKDSGGSEFTSRVVEGVLGIPVHYSAVVDFAGFKKAIDVLGGVEVDVERPFDDYKYPIPGEECAEPEELRWEHVHFDAGLQTMGGERALKYVRSRRAVGPEGSDFARSVRQQKIILAVKDTALSLSLFSDFNRVRELYQTFGESIVTDLGLAGAERLLQVAQGIGEVRTEVINGDKGLLVAPENRERFGNSWVLVPRQGDFSEVRAYVDELLFGE